MARGGARPGAGRKKGLATLLSEAARNKVAEMVEKEIVPMAKAQIAKAKKGDTFAFKELMDRAFGKAQVHIDHTTDGEQLPQPIMPVTTHVQNNDSDQESRETDEED